MVIVIICQPIKHLSEAHHNFQFVRCILRVYVKFLLVCSESIDGGLGLLDSKWHKAYRN